MAKCQNRALMSVWNLSFEVWCFSSCCGPLFSITRTLSKEQISSWTFCGCHCPVWGIEVCSQEQADVSTMYQSLLLQVPDCFFCWGWGYSSCPGHGLSIQPGQLSGASPSEAVTLFVCSMLWRHLHFAYTQFLEGQTFPIASQGSSNQAHLRERATSPPPSSSL